MLKTGQKLSENVGYRLIYSEAEILPAKRFLRGKPIGFVKPVPDGITD